jgi:hypothetical protein
MCECERTWGSKGRASWKVTLSSCRWVLYPIRLASSCAYLLRFRPSPSVTVTLLLFSSHPLGFLFAEALATCDLPCPPALEPVHLPSPPLFFSHGNSKFEGRGWILPNSSSLSPTSHPCPAHRSIYATASGCSPLRFSSALSPFLSIPSPSLHDPDCQYMLLWLYLLSNLLIPYRPLVYLFGYTNVLHPRHRHRTLPSPDSLLTHLTPWHLFVPHAFMHLLFLCSSFVDLTVILPGQILLPVARLLPPSIGGYFRSVGSALKFCIGHPRLLSRPKYVHSV